MSKTEEITEETKASMPTVPQGDTDTTDAIVPPIKVSVPPEKVLDVKSNVLLPPVGYMANGEQQRHRKKMKLRKINALKKLQVECTKIDAKFYEEIMELESKYASLYSPLFEKRKQIVTGQHDPTDEECDLNNEDEEIDVSDAESESKKDDEEVEDVDDNESSVSSKESDGKSQTGLPGFWLKALKNTDMLGELIQKQDEPILDHLIDIRVVIPESNIKSFILEFHFEPNEYFTNEVLTKQYEMRCEPEKDDPFSFKGPEIYKCEGCTIKWNEGKDVTMSTKVIKKKNKFTNVVKEVVKTFQNESFFNFFKPPLYSDEESQAALIADFEVGQCIREHIVPRAVLYYTGEIFSDDAYEEIDEEDELENDYEESFDLDEDDDDIDKDDLLLGKEDHRSSRCNQQ